LCLPINAAKYAHRVSFSGGLRDRLEGTPPRNRHGKKALRGIDDNKVAYRPAAEIYWPLLNCFDRQSAAKGFHRVIA
ncbi:MAG: hypothetical protein AAF862_16950, partial [Pseudomonadota bacterium]